MVITLIIVVLFFTVYTPFYLKKYKGKIKPSNNIFDEFVNNDIGYMWSIDKERRIKFREALDKRKKK